MGDAFGAEYGSRRPAVDAGKLWAGGLATAVVAALLTVAGIVVSRGLLNVPVLAPKGDGVWGDASTGWYAFGAAVVSLAAAGLMHVLLLFTPRPLLFFGWIAALATVVSVLVPLSLGGDLAPRMATAGLNLVLGIAIGSLVAGSGRSAVHVAF